MPPGFGAPASPRPGAGHEPIDTHLNGPGTLIPQHLHGFPDATLARMLHGVREEHQRATDDATQLRTHLARDHGRHVDAVMRARHAALGEHARHEKKHPDGRVKDAFVTNRQSPAAEKSIAAWCRRRNHARMAERSVALLEGELRARGRPVPPDTMRSRHETPWEGWRAEQARRERAQHERPRSASPSSADEEMLENDGRHRSLFGRDPGGERSEQ